MKKLARVGRGRDAGRGAVGRSEEAGDLGLS